MSSVASKLFGLAVFSLLLPLISSGAAIQINAVCQLGNCDSPDSIGVGQTAAGSFNFLYTFADGDQYSVAGSYNNSYPSQQLAFEPVVTYLNNNGNIFTPAVQTDVLSLVMFQNFYDPVGSSWDGQYCQTIPFNVTSLARANGNTYFDGNGIGFLNSGPGTSSQSNCANLSFTASQNASSYMLTQTLLDFTFLGGNLSGASISSSAPSSQPNLNNAAAIPEPSQALSTAASLLALASIALFRNSSRRPSSTL